MTEGRGRFFLCSFIGALMLCQVAAAFETSMIFAAMAKLVAEFGDANTAGWLVTGYLLVGAGVAAIMGRLGDLYGRKEIMLALLAIGVIGSLISGLSSNFAFVLLGRCLQGLTGALMPLCLGLIREHVPKKNIPLAIGLMVSGAGAGTSAGLIIGGVIVDMAPWRAIFLASGLLAAIAVVVGWFLIPGTRRRAVHTNLDLLGGILFLPGVALVLLAASKGMSWGWTSTPVLSSLVVGLLLMTGWAIRSARQENPLIDVKLFANRDILIANLCMAALAIGALQITQVFSLMLQQPVWTGIGQGVSATDSGLIKLPSNIISLAGGPVAGIMAVRLGHRQAVIWAALCTAAGWLAAIWFHGDIPHIITILIVISFGTTMVYALLPAIIVNSAPEERTSEAAGMLSVTRSTFMGIGAQVVAILLTYDTVTSAEQAGRFPSEQSYRLVFLSVALTTGSIAILSLWLVLKKLARGREGGRPVQL